MTIEMPNTERSRPATIFGLRAAALAGLIVVAGLPVTVPVSSPAFEQTGGIVVELDLAGHHGSTCCP